MKTFIFVARLIHQKMLKNKVVIITGASSGIGKALVEIGVQQGAKVIMAARNYVGLCEFREELIQKYQADVLAVKADVSKESDCKIIIQDAINKYGTIDILINNAGISMRALFQNLDIQVLKQLMDVNFWGTVYCTKFALPEIVKNKGVIVGVSSIAGYNGLPGRTGYSASKFAMNGFLSALRLELKHTGTHVMVACPGFTASNIRFSALVDDGSAQGETSMEEGKMMTSEEVAHSIIKGILKRKRTLVMTTQGKLAVWLNKLIPSLSDNLVINHFKKEKNPLL